MHVGVIGAGVMGHGMARSLMRHGHRITVIAHRHRAAIDDLVAKGAGEVATMTGLAKAAEVILICVTTSKVVEEIMVALRPHLRHGQIVLDAGTSEPQSSRRLAHELARQGVAFADIPVTGGPEQAEKGELGVLCGADPATFAAIRPLLACLATTVRHFGPPGSGHTAKLIANYLVTGMVALVAETFTAAHKAQIDWSDLYAVMLNGSANSGVLRQMVEPALSGNFDGYRFSLANAAKDIGYYGELAEELDCASRLTESVAEVFAKAVETGHGGRNVGHLLDPAIDDVT